MGDTATILILSNTKQEFGFFDISASAIEEREANYSQKVKELASVVGVEIGLVQEVPYC